MTPLLVGACDDEEGPGEEKSLAVCYPSSPYLAFALNSLEPFAKSFTRFISKQIKTWNAYCAYLVRQKEGIPSSIGHPSIRVKFAVDFDA